MELSSVRELKAALAQSVLAPLTEGDVPQAFALSAGNPPGRIGQVRQTHGAGDAATVRRHPRRD
jgi:hypothetical protein